MGQIGDLLRQTREARSIEMAVVEEETKIRAKYLMALEAGTYNDIPGPVYVKGFLRTYANYLGLDGNALVEELKAELEPAPEEKVRAAAALADVRVEAPARKAAPRPAAPRTAAAAPKPGSGGRWFVPVLALGLVGAVVGFGLWWMLRHGHAAPVQQPPPATTASTPSPIPASSNTPTGTQPPPPAPRTVQVNAQPIQDGVWPITLQGADSVTVKLTLPSHGAWLLVQADGQVLGIATGETFAAGRELIFTGKKEVRIRVGWPEGVKVTVPGQELPAITYTNPLDIVVTAK